MFLINWYRELIELRQEIAAKKRELEYCESCETLKLQLALANDEKKQLLNRLLEKPEKTETEQEIVNPKAILPNRLTFSARRQMLEAEDRARAKVIRDNSAIKPVTSSKAVTVEEIEKEIGVN